MTAKTKYPNYKLNCRHKRTILASANFVAFIPDQEPFEADKIECASVSEINVGCINIHYCPVCKTIRDIEVEPNTEVYTETCTSDNRCNGHQ